MKLATVAEKVPTSEPAEGVSLGTFENVGVGLSGISHDETFVLGADRPLEWNEDNLFPYVTTKGGNPQGTTILQAFNMSWKYIEKNLDYIKEAGYEIIQISPVTKSLEFSGIWWENYQPIDLSVFQNRLGNKEELESLFSEANKRGLRVIVDVVLNHMADPARVKGETLKLDYPQFSAENFNYPWLFLSWSKFQAEVAKKLETNGVKVFEPDGRGFTPEFSKWYSEEKSSFYHSNDSYFFRQFSEWLERSGNRYDIDLQDLDPASECLKQAALEFIRVENPLLGEDFAGRVQLSISQNEYFQIQGANSKKEIEEIQSQPFYERYKAARDRFFPISPLVIEEFYWNINHSGAGPLYENEWDDLRKAWWKWFPGLADLDTTQEHVKNIHADFLYSLIEMGARGFRLDAVKHFQFDYFANLIRMVRDRFDAAEVKPVGTAEKIHVYGEIATGDLAISNLYRETMSVTDFFLTDSLLKVFDRKTEGLSFLSIDALQKSEEGFQRGVSFPRRVFPSPEGQKGTAFEFGIVNSPLERRDFKFSSSVVFSVLHDSKIGFMYRFSDYQASILATAYVLANADGDALVFGSDEDLPRNGGVDYKERIVVAGIKYRAIVGGLLAADLKPRDLIGVDSDEILGVRRGSQGVCIISRDLSKQHRLQSVHGLNDGEYFEILTEKVFTFRDGEILNGTFLVGAKSVAYFIPKSFSKI